MCVDIGLTEHGNGYSDKILSDFSGVHSRHTLVYTVLPSKVAFTIDPRVQVNELLVMDDPWM